MFKESSIKESKIKDVAINKVRNKYYLCVTYEAIDRLDNVHEVIFNNVPLNIINNLNLVSIFQHASAHSLPFTSVDIGFGTITCSDEFAYTDKIVKYATKEMTLEEIEEKLGHKIKIVSDKEKDNEQKN